MFGYAGRVLYVDLTRKKTKINPLRNKFCERYIGSLNASIMAISGSSINLENHRNTLIIDKLFAYPEGKKAEN